MPDWQSHKGWYTPRGLPHLDSPDVMQAITFRLGDSLPYEVLFARRDEGSAESRRKIAALLDAGHGSCILRKPEVAALVEKAILHGDRRQYDLYAWVVMPNHVHALIAPIDGARLPDIVRRWKSWTAREINRLRGTSGTIWQAEYFDRYMRDGDHVEATIHYIEQNPVQAGLVKEASQWAFGSARRRVGGTASSPSSFPPQ